MPSHTVKERRKKGNTSLKKLARKRISSGPGALSASEQGRLIAAGGGGFTTGTKKKTRSLAKRKPKRKKRT